MGNIEEFNERVVEAIMQAAGKTIPKTKGNNLSKSVH